MKLTHDVTGKKMPCEIYMANTDEKIIYDTMHLKRLKKWDNIVLVTGEEGDGKSQYAAQRALYMDSDLSIKNIVFNEKQAIEAFDTLPKGSSIVWDEADALGSHWASKMFQTIKAKFKRIRKYNYTVFLVTPSLFDLNKYFVMHRIRCLFHIYSSGVTRGFFNFFNKTRLKNLYLRGHRDWNMYAQKRRIRGRFTKIPKGFPIDYSDDGEYECKKDEAMQKVGKPEEDVPQSALRNIHLGYVQRGLEHLKKKYDVKLTQRDFGVMCDVSSSTARLYIKEVKDLLNSQSA